MRRLLQAGLLAALVACGGRAASDEPAPPPPPPDLTGVTVMLLPVQVPAPAGLSAEVERQLTDRAPHVTWVLGPELQRAIDRSPAWRLRLDALPPGIMQAGGQYRVADPLYGDLRRLGAMVDARIALLPFAARMIPDSTSSVLQVSGAIIDTFGGRVLWLGTVRGEPATPGDSTLVPTAAAALARAVVR